MLAFLTPIEAANGLGEFSMGRTAGNGIDGAGDADRLIDGDEPKEDRRLCEMAGGFIGSASEVGVPGIEGAGEAGAKRASEAMCARGPCSGGAGLLEEILLAGRSIFVTLLYWLRVNWPSFVFKL